MENYCAVGKKVLGKCPWDWYVVVHTSHIRPVVLRKNNSIAPEVAVEIFSEGQWLIASNSVNSRGRPKYAIKSPQKVRGLQ